MKNHVKKLLAFLIVTVLLVSHLPVIYADVTPPYCGIDVSRWQEEIDWKKTAKTEVSFAVIRCYAAGKDSCFDQNYSGAVDNGLYVGAYVYMYALTQQEAEEEARGVLEALEGRGLDLPLFLDVEDKDVLSLGKKTVTNLMLTELNIFEQAGYNGGIYSSSATIKSFMDLSKLIDYDWWVAKWSCHVKESDPTVFTFSDQSPVSGNPACDMWQFSDCGDGHLYGAKSAKVDLNYCYTDYINLGPEAGGHTLDYEESEPSLCPYCGENHTGFFGFFVRLFHRLLYLFGGRK